MKMRYKRLELMNWKNFREAAVDLPLRGFLIGPNASGKSNFLDAFRFLRDLAVPAGGLQRACQERGGISALRNLAARNPSHIRVAVTLVDESDTPWTYDLSFTQEGRFPKQGAARVQKEVVRKGAELLLERPDADDRADDTLLSQTALEQVSKNRTFRWLTEQFTNISYLHLVPQMIRENSGWSRDLGIPDMYGGRLLELIASTPENTRKRRLEKIREVLTIAVPQFRELTLHKDKRGVPHLEVRYEHWRPNAGRQNENQLSDGTLRLIGFLWALQEGSGLLLMVEPELSLHPGIVRQLGPFIHKMQTRGKQHPRQVLASTHSVDLLSDQGIAADEVLVFTPDSSEGTQVRLGVEIDSIRNLMEHGRLTAAEVALPYTDKPETPQQFALFEP